MRQFPGSFQKLQLNMLTHAVSRFTITYNLKAEFYSKPFMSDPSLINGGSSSLKGLSVKQNKDVST